MKTDWIYLAYDRNQWWAVVNEVTNLRFPQKKDFAAWNLLAKLGVDRPGTFLIIMRHSPWQPFFV